MRLAKIALNFSVKYKEGSKSHTYFWPGQRHVSNLVGDMSLVGLDRYMALAGPNACLQQGKYASAVPVLALVVLVVLVLLLYTCPNGNMYPDRLDTFLWPSRIHVYGFEIFFCLRFSSILDISLCGNIE